MYKTFCKTVLFCVVFILFGSKAFVVAAQDSSFTKKFVLSFYKKFDVPEEIRNDSCSTSVLLLKLFIDDNYKVSVIEFSDNASEKFITELEKVKHKLYVQEIENYFRGKKQKGINLLFPFAIVNEAVPCSSTPKINLNNFSRFNKNNISGLCFIADPIVITIWPGNY